jgi:HEAT-like repeat
MDALKGRQLKKQVLALLRSEPFDAARGALCEYPPRRVVNPLIGFFCHPEPLVRWRAITAMGTVVAALAEQQMESARVVMRRLMWSLNDESGGIGWGAPEAMGDIMAKSRSLAEEYACILVSYLDPEGNYLEHPVLQRGLLWGIGRLARARPKLAAPAHPFLSPYLTSSDPHLRGLAAWTGTAPGMGLPADAIRRLARDTGAVEIYADGRIQKRTIRDLISDLK